MVSLLLIVACVQYRLHHQQDDSTPHADGDSGSPGDTAPDPDDSVCGVRPAAVGEAHGEPTCGPLAPVDWEVTVDDIYVEGTCGSEGAIGRPSLAPDPSGATRIYVGGSFDYVMQMDATGRVRDTYGMGEILSPPTIIRDGQGSNLWLAAASIKDGDNNAALEVQNASTAELYEVDGDFTGFRGASATSWDHSGVHFAFPSGVVANGAVVDRFEDYYWTLFAAVSDVDNDAMPDLANGLGIWRHDGTGSTWVGLPDSGWRGVQVFPVSIGGSLSWMGTDGNEEFRADGDGVVQWIAPPAGEHHTDYLSAVGDVDGDGVPELCAAIDDRLVMLDVDGNIRWAVGPTDTGESPTVGGGCSMADLDADGLFEVVEWGETGLWIRDGATGDVLGGTDDIRTVRLWNGALIADADGDGSAEIIVSGGWTSEWDECDTYDYPQGHLFVVRPATGRWARTRPIWNQMGYDITSVRDDGTLVNFPRPSWSTYDAYRAQPAHDGDHPDLTLDVTGTCADECGPGGTVEIGIQASNLGSHDAPPGARIQLFTWTEGGGVELVGTKTVSDGIPSLAAAEGVVFDVPWEDWGDARYAQIDGADGDECDLVNDRIDIWDDPCH